VTGGDVATSGRLTIPAGSVYLGGAVRALGDLTKEADERFLLALSDPHGAVFPGPWGAPSATGTVGTMADAGWPRRWDGRAGRMVPSGRRAAVARVRDMR
jgi:hypothetical protein